jgi:hypothetical protein
MESPFNDPKIAESLKITDVRRDTPVFVEAYRRLRKLITDGVLKKGDKLPGENTLASMLGIGRTSLRTALTVLYEDGYIITYRGRGSFVACGPEGEDGAFPSGIMLPPARIALQGKLSSEAPNVKKIENDGFLLDKLRPGERDIISEARMFLLDGKQAVYSTCYYIKGVLGDESAPGWNLWDSLSKEAASAECEMVSVPTDSVKSMYERCAFSGAGCLLVTSSYSNRRGELIAYSKDYYDCGTIRYRMTQRS